MGLVMRGRYLMREFWSDSDLFLRLDAQDREILVGLWMLADDDGWMPRDIPAIGAALFAYMDRAPREQLVRATLERLAKVDKVVSHRCCLFLPSVPRYPRAGKKTAEHHAAHLEHLRRASSRGQKHSNGFEPIQTDLNPSPVPSLPNQSSPVGEPATGPDGAGRSRFEEMMRNAGIKPELIA